MRSAAAVLSLVLALSVTAPVSARVKPGARARNPAPAAAPDQEAQESDEGSAAMAAFDSAAKRAAAAAPANAADVADAADAAGEAAAVANLLALSSGQAPAPTGPPAALARKLVPVLAALNLKLKLRTPLKMVELQYFGAADVDGDGVTELIVTWGRGASQGGVALARRAETEHRVVAIAQVGEPVLRVQAVPLAGDRSRHLLVRSGVNHPGGGTDRRMSVWGAGGGALRKIWEHVDVDRIEGNPDLSKDREATLSDITFRDGAAGKPGTLTVAVTEYRAPRGKGPEATETRGARTLHYGFDRKRGVLVKTSQTEATREQLAADELGARGPGAPGAVPPAGPEADEAERAVTLRSSDDLPVHQRVETDGPEVINAVGLRARENMSRIDLPAGPGERMQRRDAALRRRSEENRARQKARDDARKEAARQKAQEERGAAEAEDQEPAGEESGPRPKGVEAVDSAK